MDDKLFTQGQPLVIADQGYDVQSSTAQEFDKIIRADFAMYAKVIREANIREN